jgi:pentalenolactone synthase
MTTTALPHLPFPREGILDIAPLFRTLRETAPISPVRTPAGDVAWLVAGHAEAKALFGDRRLGRTHPNPERAAKVSGAALLSGPTGDDHASEQERHTRMRRLLTPAFSARRMRALREHVTELVDDLLTRLAEREKPADLHETLSFPLPALVICELLGVPYADRRQFRVWADQMGLLHDRETAENGRQELADYIRGLAAEKRGNPGEDLLSDLVAAQAEEGFDDDYIAGLGAVLLFAGHETTVARIDFGTILLLKHRAAYEALRRDSSVVGKAVEEILRIAAPGGSSGGLPRYAQEDIEIAGVRIRAGDAVLLATTSANRDPEAFENPDSFDITRDATGHLTFGHGPYFCIGASLARVELEAVFSALPRRFPALELAVPVEQLSLREDVLTGGLKELPVTW